MFIITAIFSPSDSPQPEGQCEEHLFHLHTPVPRICTPWIHSILVSNCVTRTNLLPESHYLTFHFIIYRWYKL